MTNLLPLPLSSRLDKLRAEKVKKLADLTAIEDTEVALRGDPDTQRWRAGRLEAARDAVRMLDEEMAPLIRDENDARTKHLQEEALAMQRQALKTQQESAVTQRNALWIAGLSAAAAFGTILIVLVRLVFEKSNS